MYRKIRMLQQRLRRLDRAYRRLARSTPSPEQAAKNADKALAAVLELLSDPEVIAAMQQHIPPAREYMLVRAESFYARVLEQQAELIRLEARLLQEFKISSEKIREYAERYRRSPGNGRGYVADPSELIELLKMVHHSTKASLNEARRLSRKPKKQRKRRIRQGIASAVFGAVSIVANTQLAPVFIFSYALGGNALHQALRDLAANGGDGEGEGDSSVRNHVA